MSYSPNFVSDNPVDSARKLARNYTNGSGITLVQSTPVGTLTNGNVSTLDLTSKTSVDGFVGLFIVDTPNTASGQVIDSGILENITTSFVVGDAIWANKNGGLQTTTPVIGTNSFVSGDYLLYIGVIVQNEFDNTKKDLKILIERRGRL